VAGRKSMRNPLLAGNGPLAKVSPILAFVVVLGLFVAGVLVKGVIGAALLGLLALGVATLLVGAWKVLKPSDRVLRVVVLLMLVTVAITVLR
jgi:hypothetical protein